MREFTGPTDWVRHVAFVPGDPPRLAAVVRQAAYLWRLDGPEPVVLKWKDKEAGSEPRLLVSQDGRRLVAGSGEVPVCWDLRTHPPRAPVSLPVPGLLTARLAGPDGQLVVVAKQRFRGTSELHAVRWKVPSKTRSPGKPVGLPMPAELAPRVMALSSTDWQLKAVLSDDASRLAICPEEKAVHIWDVGPEEPPRTITLRGYPCGLSFSPDGSRLVIDAGTTLYVYDAATLEVVASWKAKYCYAPGLAWSPDGRLLARTDVSTTVRIYEAATGRQVMSVGVKGGRLMCAAFSSDGLMLATGAQRGPVRVWDVE